MSMEYHAIYSDSLSHHGILGQKWGVRRFQNADRTWTAAGKERYGRAQEAAKESSQSLLTSERYKSANAKRDAAYKEVKDFYNLSEKERDKYIRKASDAEYDRNKIADINQMSRDELFEQYKYGDFDQGRDSSFSYYLKDKGIDPKEWTAREYKANTEWRKEMKSLVNESLDKISDTKMRDAIKSDPNLERRVEEAVSAIDSRESNMHGYWYNLLEL